MLRYLSLSVILLALTACTNSGSSVSSETVTPSPASTAAPQSPAAIEASADQGELTYEKFLAVTLGDSLATVQETLGMEGELSSYGNPDSGMGDGYVFPNREIQETGTQPFISVSLNPEGKVGAIQQYGLAMPQGDIKLEQFTQVKVGEMTLQDVEKIFGVSGILGTVTEADPKSAELYGMESSDMFEYWFMSSDGSLARITVDDKNIVVNQVQDNTKYQPPSE